jgi:hypothetical protein
MFLMVLLTFIVGCITVKARVTSVRNGDVSIKHYRVMNDLHMPETVTKSTRNYSNLFEVPILFYVVSTLYISLNIETVFAVSCAWFFVISRVIHSYIHLTYNNVIHRMVSYWAGLIAIFVLWVTLLIHQM